MAVMLGAFTMLGISPGPSIAGEHLDLVWILIWTLIIANILAALMFLAVGRWLVVVAFLRNGLLVPFILLFTLVGAYVGSNNWRSLVVLVVLGLLGYGFKRAEWPRAPFVVGLVLGPVVDVSLHQSLTLWGPWFVLRPIASGLALATLVTLVVSLRRTWAREGVQHGAV
jgi:TctA family transporter